MPLNIDVKDASGATVNIPVLPAQGPALKAASLPVSLASDQPLPAGEAHLGQVGGTTVVSSASFARPATGATYALAKLIANNATAGSVIPMTFAGVARVAGGSGMIRRARLRKSSTGLGNASFRLHLYGVSPTSTVGDNGTYNTDGVATYLGAFDIQIDQAFSDGSCGAGLSRIGGEINFKLASGTSIFGLLEARAPYVGIASETFTADLEIIQD